MGNSGQRLEQSHKARIDKQHPQHGATTAIVVKTVFLGSTASWVFNGWDLMVGLAGHTPATNGFVQSRGTKWSPGSSEMFMSLLGPGKLVDTSKCFVVVRCRFGIPYFGCDPGQDRPLFVNAPPIRSERRELASFRTRITVTGVIGSPIR